MSKLYGNLSVFMYVVLPTGHEKRVSLASIPCEYEQREAVFRKFVDCNGHRLMKDYPQAQFVFRESVDL